MSDLWLILLSDDDDSNQSHHPVCFLFFISFFIYFDNDCIFGLVALFNAYQLFLGYLMPKPFS